MYVVYIFLVFTELCPGNYGPQQLYRCIVANWYKNNGDSAAVTNH